jgi:hypothetical protein
VRRGFGAKRRFIMPEPVQEQVTVPPVQSTSGTSAQLSQGSQLDQILAAIASLSNNVAASNANLSSVSQAASQGQAELQTQITDLAKQFTTFKDTIASSISGSVANESDVGTTGRNQWLHNAGDDLERGLIDRDRVSSVMLQTLSNMVGNAQAIESSALKYADGVWARSLDHFGALPPIAPRSATGPGTAAA